MMIGSDSWAGSRRCVEVTCTGDGRAHQVDDFTFSAGISDGAGRLPAVCGRTIVAAPLAYPPGPLCPLCTAVLTLGVHHPAR